MKKLIALVPAILCYALVCGQPHGHILESLKFESELLMGQVGYSVYLPADYDVSRRSYPVVYLLHAYADDETSWIRFGQLGRYADLAIQSGQIVPMIIIMPAAGKSWYINDRQNKQRYEDMFFQEFIPEMEKAYRIQSGKSSCGVAGLDMGGYAAMLYTLKQPSRFAACALLNAAILTDEYVVDMPQEAFQGWYAALFCGAADKREQRLSSHWHNNSVLELVRDRPDAQLAKVSYYIDCADDGEWIIGNCGLHLMLKEKRVPHEFRVRDGVNNWAYGRSGIVEALEFISRSFAR